MRRFVFVGACSGVVLLAGAALAQMAPSPASPLSPQGEQERSADKPSDRTSAMPAPAAHNSSVTSSSWRSSKMIGLNVYNTGNEKLGDINEILIDQSGRVTGFVVGVGGFLGMGQRDIMVTPDKLNFVNEAPPSTRSDSGTNTSGSATPTPGAISRGYPDHAVMSATKDEVKALPEFKYAASN